MTIRYSLNICYIYVVRWKIGLLKPSNHILCLMTCKMKIHWFSCIYQLSLSLEAKMPTFSLQCGPNADPNIRKVRNADPMPPLRTFLAALGIFATMPICHQNPNWNVLVTFVQVRCVFWEPVIWPSTFWELKLFERKFSDPKLGQLG